MKTGKIQQEEPFGRDSAHSRRQNSFAKKVIQSFFKNILRWVTYQPRDFKGFGKAFTTRFLKTFIGFQTTFWGLPESFKVLQIFTLKTLVEVVIKVFPGQGIGHLQDD